jgi:hypothetical protein
MRYLLITQYIPVLDREPQGYKTGRIFRNSAKTGGIGPVRILKPLNLMFTVSKFQKKIKVSKKYVKKLDQILGLLVKNFL